MISKTFEILSYVTQLGKWSLQLDEKLEVIQLYFLLVKPATALDNSFFIYVIHQSINLDSFILHYTKHYNSQQIGLIKSNHSGELRNWRTRMSTDNFHLEWGLKVMALSERQTDLLFKIYIVSNSNNAYCAWQHLARLFASARLVSSPRYAGPIVMTYWPLDLVHLASRRGAFQAFNDSVLDCDFCSKYPYFKYTGKYFLTETALWNKRQCFYVHKFLNWIHNLILKAIAHSRSQWHSFRITSWQHF